MHKTKLTIIFTFFVFFLKAQTYNNLEAALKDSTNVKVLNLANQQLKYLDYNISKLKNLEALHIENNGLESLPIGFLSLLKLEKIQADHNLFREHSISSFFALRTIKALDLSYNNIKSLASSLHEGREIRTLEVLKVSNAQIESVSTELSLMPNLKYLDLSHNKMNYIEGKSVLNLKYLDTLILSHNQFRFLTSDTITAYNLRYIDISQNPYIWGVQDLLNRLPKLEYLNASYVGDISSSGLSFGVPINKKYYLKSPIKTLLLSHAHLTKVPKAMSEMENLEFLDLSHNAIKEIPGTFRKMKSLKKMDLRANSLSEKEQKRLKKLLPNCEFIF